MAIDTRNKRASLLGLGLSPLVVLPTADGTIDQADRQHILGLYAGIPLAAPVIAVTTPPERTVRIPVRSRVVRIRRTQS